MSVARLFIRVLLVLPLLCSSVVWGQALVLSSPKERQVFQQDASGGADVKIAGTLSQAAQRLEVRAWPQSGRMGQGFDWITLVSSPAAGSFTAHRRMTAGGWYWLEVRAVRNGTPAETVRVERVGVGEVFVSCGQSNSTNSAEVRTYPQSDLVSAFDGNNWVVANDPQPASHDNSGGGSVYPKLGDKLAATLKVPVGFTMTGHGGRPVQDWLWESQTGLYEWLRDRIWALGENRPRCILWHQGESNSWPGAPYMNNYADTLTTIINRLNADIGYGLPWIVCQATYIPGLPLNDTVRAQQQLLWTRGTALQGPDTDQWREGYRHSGDGIHFNLAGLEVFSTGYHDWIVRHFHSGALPTATPTGTPVPGGCALVSQGRPVQADSVFGAAYGPEKVTDGAIGTQEGRWISGEGANHWCRIDLGQLYDLCQVRVYSDEAMGADKLWNMTAYTVHGSVDGAGVVQNWPLLATFSDPCGAPYADYPGDAPNAHNAHAVSGTYRHVGLHITGGDGECGPICRVQEVQVFAAPFQTRTPTPSPTPAQCNTIVESF